MTALCWSGKVCWVITYWADRGILLYRVFMLRNQWFHWIWVGIIVNLVAHSSMKCSKFDVIFFIWRYSLTSFLRLPAYNVLLIKYYLQCSDQILSNDTKHLCIPITTKKMNVIEIAYFVTFRQIQDMTSFFMYYSGYLWRHCNVPLFVFFDFYKIHSKVHKHTFWLVPSMTMFLLTALSGESVMSANF